MKISKLNKQMNCYIYTCVQYQRHFCTETGDRTEKEVEPEANGERGVARSTEDLVVPTLHRWPLREY